MCALKIEVEIEIEVVLAVVDGICSLDEHLSML